MDAREALRRYLEQRRESGETELVLDALSVEEALKLIGVRAESPAPAARRAAQSHPRALSRPTPDDVRPLRADDAQAALGEEARIDWRSVLRGDEPPPVADRAAAPRRGEPRVQAPATSDRYPAGMEMRATQGSTPPASAPPSGSDLPPGIVVGGGGRELFGSESPFASLDDIERAVAQCRLCPLSREAKNPVPGVGNPNAELVCVGEAPGATEDEMGLPFVGQAGQLLTKILAAISLSRDDVFICNVLKHRPPGNRNPLPSEVEACSPYLVRQIELIKPKVIVALGTFAAQTLLETKESIGKLRGRIHRYYGVPLVVTYHPAALLRNPAWKRPTWEDVQLARQLLDRARSAR